MRKEIIDRMAAKGYTKTAAGTIIDDMVSVIEEALIEGESVMFRGFGTFRLKDREAKRTWNPAISDHMIIPAHKVAIFSPGDSLKRKIRESEYLN